MKDAMVIDDLDEQAALNASIYTPEDVQQTDIVMEKMK